MRKLLHDDAIARSRRMTSLAAGPVSGFFIRNSTPLHAKDQTLFGEIKSLILRICDDVQHKCIGAAHRWDKQDTCMLTYWCHVLAAGHHTTVSNIVDEVVSFLLTKLKNEHQEHDS